MISCFLVSVYTHKLFKTSSYYKTAKVYLEKAKGEKDIFVLLLVTSLKPSTSHILSLYLQWPAVNLSSPSPGWDFTQGHSLHTSFQKLGIETGLIGPKIAKGTRLDIDGQKKENGRGALTRAFTEGLRFSQDFNVQLQCFHAWGKERYVCPPLLGVIDCIFLILDCRWEKIWQIRRDKCVAVIIKKFNATFQALKLTIKWTSEPTENKLM